MPETVRLLLKAYLFALDDTLYPERDYVMSGFRAAAAVIPQVEDAAGKLRSAYREGKAAFDAVLQDAHIFSEALKAECLRAYRGHSPVLQLDGGVRRTLEELRRRGKHLGIVTDGRPESQRAKIEALGLLELVDEIIVTDELGGEPFRKPCDIAFRIMQRRFGCDYGEMVYIGDNPRKDFAAPLALGMRCCRVQIPDGLYGGEPTPDGVVCIGSLGELLSDA
jgi:putative hydrolase of the HAD superfamily